MSLFWWWEFFQFYYQCREIYILISSFRSAISLWRQTGMFWQKKIGTSMPCLTPDCWKRIFFYIAVFGQKCIAEKWGQNFTFFCLNGITEYWTTDVLCSTMYWFIIDRICNLKCQNQISKSSCPLLPWLNILLRLPSTATFWPNPQPQSQLLFTLISAK